MSNLHLITGYAGKDHVTAADQGAFNAALIGADQFVLNKGNGLARQIQNNNLVRVYDGELMIQGRYIRLDPGTYVDLNIDSGTHGTMRNDLIVARYTKDAVTGIEDCNLVVLKGTPVASNPADPAYTEGDILNDGSLQVDMPLYRVVLNGINIQKMDALFTVKDISIPSLENGKQDKTDTLTAETALADGDYLPFFDVSAGSHRKVLWSRIKTVLGNVFAAKEHSHTLAALGAAASGHKHSTSDINSGILAVARGGTGVASLEELVQAIHASRVQTGSYTGTGTYGKSNPNSITFDFEPKMVIIYKGSQMSDYGRGLTPSSGFWTDSMIWCYGQNRAQVGVSGSGGWNHITQNGNTLSWYNTERADHQLNSTTNGENIYSYIAIG